MPQSNPDTIMYIVYGVILVATLIILKMPKKKK